MADTKLKKVDKVYVLSDSTLNCYGFRLLTSGYQLADFAKNPIGYYMHLRDEGVVVRWEDIKIEGDNITGTPVINLAAKRGQQTLDEIENGFLNAASVGDIVVLEYSYEPEMMLPGQSGPTITKWCNKECSVVDVPGNSNALTRLYDHRDNLITLADITGSNIPEFELKIDNNMKKITLALTAGLLAHLNLAANADPKENEVNEAIKDLADRAEKADAFKLEVANLKKEKGDLETEVKNLKNDSVKKKVDTLLETALDDKKITPELKTQLARDYAEKPNELKALVDGMKPHESVVNAIKNNQTVNLSADEAKWKWADYQKNDPKGTKLAALKANNPTQFKAIFKEEYGKEPKI